MLAEHRRGAVVDERRLRHPDGGAHRGHRCRRRHAAGRSRMPRWTTCGSAKTCATVLIGPAGTPAFSSRARRSARANVRDQPRELRHERRAVGDARRVGGGERIVGKLGRAEHADQLAELAVVADGDDDVAVGDGEDLIGHDVGVGVAEPARRRAGDEVVHRLVGEHRRPGCRAAPCRCAGPARCARGGRAPPGWR